MLSGRNVFALLNLRFYFRDFHMSVFFKETHNPVFSKVPFRQKEVFLKRVHRVTKTVFRLFTRLCTYCIKYWIIYLLDTRGDWTGCISFVCIVLVCCVKQTEIQSACQGKWSYLLTIYILRAISTGCQICSWNKESEPCCLGENCRVSIPFKDISCETMHLRTICRICICVTLFQEGKIIQTNNNIILDSMFNMD